MMPEEHAAEETASPDALAEQTADTPSESVSQPQAPVPAEASAPADDSAPTPSVAESLEQMAQASGEPSTRPEATEATQTSESADTTPAASVDASSDGVLAPSAPPAPEADVAAATPGSVAESAPVPEAAEQSSGTENTEAVRKPEPSTESGHADRIREKLGVRKEEKPVGNIDLQAQRPEIPTNAEPVEIPGADDLTEDLEAEISAAMEHGSAEPVTTAAVPVETFGDATETEAAGAPTTPEEIGPGSKVKGVVQHIHGDDVFLNAGLLTDVVLSLKQFPEDKKPAVGDSLDAVIDNVDEDGLFRARLPQARTKSRGNWDALAVGQVVDCQVTGTNKGGLQVTVSNIKGFLPASQVDLGYVSDLEKYVGQKLAVQITEVKPRKKNLVVSRRVMLEAEREQAQSGFWESLEVGQDHTGVVKTLKNYGAFVNLGPIDGFLHIGEISWSRINHPNEVLNEGQEVQVRVLKIDKPKNRISLGMKQLMQNPWQGLGERYPSERIVTGRVTRTADFGAFVELEPGVEGLVHISQLAWRRVGSVNEVLNVGDERDFKVLEVDQKRKRVSLSLKALEQKPESVRKAEEAEEPRPPRKPNPDLRGGMGGGAEGGGLFGNPSDFS